MRNDLADVTLVVDRSGSMHSCQSDAEGGINNFIKKQREHEGDCVFSLVQFDTEYEFVHKGVPIDSVGEYKLIPRGWTALLDAVGRAMTETGERLAAMDEKDRPGVVIFVIVTDGYENSSKEFTNAQIKEMIEQQQTEYNWQFTFLGATEDAFATAGGMGINAKDAAVYTSGKVGAAYDAASLKAGRARTSGIRGQSLSTSFTDEEREAMND